MMRQMTAMSAVKKPVSFNNSVLSQYDYGVFVLGVVLVTF